MTEGMKNDSMFVNGPSPAPFPATGLVWAMCEAHELIARTLEGWNLVCAWPNGTSLLSMPAQQYQAMTAPEPESTEPFVPPARDLSGGT